MPIFVLAGLFGTISTAGAERRLAVEIPSLTNGQPLPGILFVPDGGKAAPAVIVLHTGRLEFEPADEAYARELSRNGYVALVLNYLTNAREKFWSPRITGDLVGTVNWLRQRPEVGGRLVGTVGFSLGVHSILLAAKHRAVSAVVVYYGAYDPRKYREHAERIPAQIPMPIDKAAEVNGAVLMLHGTADDEVPLRSAEEMRNALEAAGKTVELVTYQNTTHRFDRGNVEGMDGEIGRTGFTYRENPEAAKDAFQRTLGWLGKHIGKVSASGDHFSKHDSIPKVEDVGDEPVGPTGRTPSQVISGSDLDGDGKVSKSEFRGPTAAFSRIDANKDGFLTKQEFIDAWR